MTALTYAGIGARKIPSTILAVMRRMASYLATKGWHLNTGGADGADRAFAGGSPLLRTVYLPWRGYNGWRGPQCVTYTEASLEHLSSIAADYHPAWERCSPAVRKLHARNVAVVFGARASGITPTRAVVCWTERGRVTGGTGLAIRLAEAENIPVFNLATMHPRDVCLAMHRLAARPVSASTQLPTPPEATPAGQSDDFESDYDFYPDSHDPCQHCEDGVYLVCPDDLCRGNGGCGKTSDPSCYRLCPHCGGSS